MSAFKSSMLTDSVAVIVPMILGLMGAYISIRPPKQRYHWSWFTVFISLGVFSAITSFIQIKTNALEANESKQDLHTRIGVLQRNLNQLGGVPKSLDNLQKGLAKGAKPDRAHLHVQRFQLHPLVPNERIKLNVYFQNKGTLPAEWQGFYMARVIDVPTPEAREQTEGQFFAEFLKRMKELKPVTNSIPAGTERWVTDIGPPLSTDQAELMKQTKAVVIFAGRIVYRDKESVRRTDYCITSFGTVIFMCQRHNDEP